jgi:ketosteroid isomerase-like protein
MQEVGLMMTSNETGAAVRACMESYLDAFERLDAAAIADHFAYPSHIASDASEVVLLQIANRQDCLAAVEKVVAMHRQLEAPSGAICDLSVVELSPRLAQASLRMEAHGRTGAMLYDFEAIYTLAQTRDGWRIAAIAHNQIPRLLDCLAQRQSGA